MLRSCYAIWKLRVCKLSILTNMLGSNPIFIVTLVFPKNEEACLFIKTIQQEIHSISFVITDLSLT